MRGLVLGLLGIAAIASVAFAGTETYSGKEIKQVAAPPCPEWYADNEFNVASGGHTFSQDTLGRMTAIWRVLTAGAVAGTLNTFSTVTSA
jgi:hypothetical protein